MDLITRIKNLPEDKWLDNTEWDEEWVEDGEYYEPIPISVYPVILDGVYDPIAWSLKEGGWSDEQIENMSAREAEREMARLFGITSQDVYKITQLNTFEQKPIDAKHHIIQYLSDRNG